MITTEYSVAGPAGISIAIVADLQIRYNKLRKKE